MAPNRTPKRKHVPVKCPLGTASRLSSMNCYSSDGPDCRLSRLATWRKKPATQNQKEFIAKRWGLRKPDAMIVRNAEFQLREEWVNALTKGAAGEIISRLKHGAAVRFSGFGSNMVIVLT